MYTYLITARDRKETRNPLPTPQKKPKHLGFTASFGNTTRFTRSLSNTTYHNQHSSCLQAVPHHLQTHSLRGHTGPRYLHSQLPSVPSLHDDAAPLSPTRPEAALWALLLCSCAPCQAGTCQPFMAMCSHLSFSTPRSLPPTRVPSRSSPYPSSLSSGVRTTSPTPSPPP